MKVQKNNTKAVVNCRHCGDKCSQKPIVYDDFFFCCSGCQTVYQILQENGLCTFYDLNENAGISLKARAYNNKYDYLIEPSVQKRLLQFESEHQNKITLFIPSVHCSSCVWLLENFNKIRTGIISSRLDFIKKELSLSYNPTEVTLKEIVELLATLGYEPAINLDSDKGTVKKVKINHSLIFKIGVVGFCFGNIMLLSFPEYFNMDLTDKVDAQYQRFFLYLNFTLSLPVFFYGASDFLIGAWQSLRDNFRRKTSILSVDIPIALGITALFSRSLFETFINHSAGYWDSLAGLVFFLLLGKWVQQITFNYLSFERNYKSYFPLAVLVKNEGGDFFKNVTELSKGDIQLIHNQEIIPTDSVLLDDKATIDYSFVTGESLALEVHKEELVYAGGRQIGKRIALTVQKPVSQSYLTQLWNDDAFKKEKETPKTNLANLFSNYFTFITLGIAFLTCIFWSFKDPSIMWLSATSVLMVACPCALTLSMPFTMNAVLGIFGRNKFYVKNQGVVQLMNEIKTIVFDKTGTLTESRIIKAVFKGKKLTDNTLAEVHALASQSMHPLSRIISETFKNFSENNTKITAFSETKGRGIEAIVNQKRIKLGNAEFLQLEAERQSEAVVHLSIDGDYKGYFSIENKFRKNWKSVIQQLKKGFNIALVSGDNDFSKKHFLPLLSENDIYFNQLPEDKLSIIKSLQSTNSKVMMIGDGLNDAGALRQSDVGISISENAHSFSPACDAILEASKFEMLPDFISFGQTALKVVKASFVLSIIYNIICISWAVSGNLSPIFAAIFMPLSTISVVLFAVGLTYFFAYRKGLLLKNK